MKVPMGLAQSKFVMACLCAAGLGAFLAGCAPPATPVNISTPTMAPTPSVVASATAPEPTALAPTATAPSAPPQVTVEPRCEAARQWSQTQDGLTLIMCFDPYPPQLGRPASYEAVLLDAAGQPLTDATVELTMVGGMATMAGEHDEEFPLELTHLEAGVYVAQATLGPSDLVVTVIAVRIRSGRQLWSFSISADELAPR